MLIPQELQLSLKLFSLLNNSGSADFPGWQAFF